ncbi:MAG: hypothetical protein PHP03_03715 [Candidatus Pacebacteria bacterium]|nr:hypothetical protein [Candidatus Paceibacterota bacterium]
MTLKVRRLVTISFIILFLLIGGFLIFYSTGLLIDLKNLTLSRSGAIYLEAQTKDIQIKIGKEKLQLNPGLFKDGILVTNLLPKNYKVEASKEGYQNWTKNIYVKPSLVSRTYPIILLPNDWSAELIYKDVAGFWTGKKYSAWKTSSGKLFINGKKAAGTDLKNWLYGDNSALTYDSAEKSYFVVNPDQNNAALNISLIFNNLAATELNSSAKIFPHPYDQKKLILNSAGEIYVLDFSNFKLETLNEKNSSVALAQNKELFIIKKTGLYSYNLATKSKKVISSKITALPEKMEVSSDGLTLAFLSGEKITLINTASLESTVISSSAKYFKFSPDGKKIAFWEDSGEIRVYFLAEQQKWSDKKSGDYASLGYYQLDQSHPFDWHSGSAHLLIKFPEKTYLLEIDDRQPINQQIINLKMDDYQYNPANNFVYFITDGIFYKTGLE